MKACLIPNHDHMHPRINLCGELLKESVGDIGFVERLWDGCPFWTTNALMFLAAQTGLHPGTRLRGSSRGVRFESDP